MRPESSSRFDAVVVGAGVSGLTTALFLARTGVEVLVVEKDSVPPPADPADALIHWNRPGVPHFRNGHAFHGLGYRTLRKRAPDILTVLLDVGASVRRFDSAIPAADRQSEDADLVALRCSRPLFEWALRKAVAREPAIDLRTGCSVADLLSDSGGRRINGVVLGDGYRINAPWVVDATGHRAALRQFLPELGARTPVVRSERSGTSYYARHFRRISHGGPEPEEYRFGPSGDLGFLRYSVLEEDSAGFVVTLNTRSSERELRILQDAQRWSRVAAALPGLADWIGPDVARPISGVCSYAGRGNVFTTHNADSTVTGLVAIGDALCQTNPTQGWGVSIALHQASVVADTIVRSGTEPSRPATLALTAELATFVEPFYTAAAMEDRARKREASGEDVDVTDVHSELFCRKVIYQLGSEDVGLYRAAQRRIHLLDNPLALMSDHEMLSRASELHNSRNSRHGSHPPPSPTKDDLLRAAHSRPQLTINSTDNNSHRTESVLPVPDYVDLVQLIGRTPVGHDRDRLLAELSSATSHAIETTGRGIDLSEENLAGLDLTDVDLRRATLNRALLHGTKLVRANMRETAMVCPGMERTDLTGADLTGAYVHALAAQTCVFDAANLSDLRDATGTLFHGCSMRRCVLTGSQLAGSAFYQCDLSEASLDRTNLQGAQINECLLHQATLTGALLDQATMVKVGLAATSLARATGHGLTIARPTDTDGLALAGGRFPRLRLDTVRGAHWSCADLAAPDADLVDVAVTDADFTGADLSRSMWRSVSMPGVVMAGASLTDAKLTGCTLRGGKLIGLRGENLNIVESDLFECDLTGAAARCLTARDVNLGRADLSHANLYRSMITGDPPNAMSLRGARMQNAVLVQAYVAADLSDADLTNVNAAYSRFSQSCLERAILDGANMFQSAWVKASFTDASLAGIRPPVFSDRCRGLLAAVEKTAGSSRDEMVGFLESFSETLATARKGST
ncbi:FAD-dependent oxidoreductase [Nocardia sp. NPDC047038]|uniref:FAD-dependent oxidoreductase n=1 Tax=Nocardia sp. NPDC047038 TaxID=3154338 RepID=UPI0033F9E860